MKKHILVISAGSVGKRHLKNFAFLGCDVSVMDPRVDRLKEAGEQVKLIKTYKNFKPIQRDLKLFDGAVIGSPPKFHIDQTLFFLKAGIPVLLEKPLSFNLEDGMRLYKAIKQGLNIPFLLGYTYRWWPALKEFRRRILNGDIGKPLHARFMMSAHLADWHPWERYQDFFMASKDLGGGALLDESHFSDLMYWFFGMPKSLFAKVEKISDLEIETDDNVDAGISYENGLRVTIHLDIFGRPHEKFISVTGDRGTLKWSFDPNHILFSNKMEGDWEEQKFSGERNDMFVNVAKEFLNILNNGAKNITCDVEDGINVLKIIEACRISSKEGREVNLKMFI